MSLIQDALKRQAEENAGMRLPGMPVQPLEPPPPPPPPEEKKNKAFPIVPFVLSLAVLLAALLGISLYLIKPKPKAVPKVIQRPVPAAPVAPAVVPAPVKVAETSILAVETVKVETVIEPVAEPLVVEEPAVVTEPILKLKKTWPELKLTGIAQGGDKQRVAILNGKMLSAGRRLGEVTVIQVRDNYVLVEFRGERRNLYIGE